MGTEPSVAPISAANVGVGRRLLARLIDCALYGIGGLGLSFSLVMWLGMLGTSFVSIGWTFLPGAPTVISIETFVLPRSDLWGFVFLLQLVTLGLAVVLLYELPLTAIGGQTVGKMLTSTQVVRTADGAVPGWRQASARWAVLYLPLLIPLIGLPLTILVAASPLFDSRRRGWHDRVASTVVVLLPGPMSKSRSTGTGHP